MHASRCFVAAAGAALPAALAFVLLCTAVSWAHVGVALEDHILSTSQRDCALITVCGEGREVRLSDLPGKYVLVDSFSMYCPHCQASAPYMVELSQLLARSPLADDITMVGLGAGNSRFEVDFFRDNYDIPFAVFPDQDMQVYNDLGAPGTPHLALAEKTPDGLIVRWEHTGEIRDPKAALAGILDAVGGDK